MVCDVLSLILGVSGKMVIPPCHTPIQMIIFSRKTPWVSVGKPTILGNPHFARPDEFTWLSNKWLFTPRWIHPRTPVRRDPLCNRHHGSWWNTRNKSVKKQEMNYYQVIQALTFLGWLSLSDPFKGESWPPTGIWKGHIESPGSWWFHMFF